MSRSRDEILEKIEDLRDKAAAGLITQQEFNERLEKLQQEIRATTKVSEDRRQDYLDTKEQIQLTQYDPILDIRESFLVALRRNRRLNPKQPSETNAAYEERMLQMTRREQQSEARIERKKSGFMQNEVPGGFVSRFVDPVKGLVYDPQRGGIRKVRGALEGLKESIKAQVKYTPIQLERIGRAGEQLEALEDFEEEYKDISDREDALEQYPEEVVEAFKGGKKAKKELEEEFAKEPLYKIRKEEAFVPESTLGWAFRMLNTGSALVAAGIGQTQKGIGKLTGAPASIRKGAGYEKTQMDTAFAQTITNIANNQGVLSQQQSMLLPPSTGFSINPFRQGTLLSLALGFAGEIGAPITPVGVVKDAAKLTRAGLKKAIKPTGTVTTAMTEGIGEAILLAAKRKELAEVLDTLKIGNIKTAENIAKKTKEGLTRQSLRTQVADIIGDYYGGVAALEKVVEDAKKAGKTQITPKGLPTDSVYLRNIFVKNNNLRPSIPLDEAEEIVTNALNRMVSTQATGMSEIPLLRRAYQIMEESSNTFKGRKSAKFGEQDIIDKNLRAARYETLDNNAIRNWIRKADKEKAAKATSDLERLNELRTKKSLSTAEELLEQRALLQSLDEAKVLKPGLGRSPTTLYKAAKSSVSEVLRDNFLKGIPEDLIAINSGYVVPVRKMYTSTGRRTRESIEHDNLVRDAVSTLVLDKARPGKMLTDDAIKNIESLQRTIGLTLPKQISDKIKSQKQLLDRGVPLTDTEYDVLTQVISGQLSVKTLDGQLIRAATEQAELSRVPVGLRTKPIPVSKAVRSPVVIKTKALARAIKILLTKKPSRLQYTSKVTGAPPSMTRLYDEAHKAKLSAQAEVAQRLEDARKRNPKDSTKAFNETIQYYVDESNKLYISKKEKGLTRSSEEIFGIDERARQIFSGDADYLKTLESKYVVPAINRARARLEKAKIKGIDVLQKKILKNSRKQNEAFIKRWNTKERNLKKQFVEFEKKIEAEKRTIRKQKTKPKQKKKAIDNANERLKKRIEKFKQKRIKLSSAREEALDELQNKLAESMDTFINKIQKIKDEEFFRDLDDPLFRLWQQGQNNIAQWMRSTEQKAEIKEARDIKSSVTASKRRKVKMLREKYKRKNIDDFVRTQYNTTDNVFDTILNNIEDIEINMPLYMSSINQRGLWKSVMEAFFTTTKRPAQFDTVLDDVIRIDDKQPYYRNNVSPITIDTVKDVALRMKEKIPDLKDKGIAGEIEVRFAFPPIGRGDDYITPIMNMMLQQQESISLQGVLQRYLQEDKSILIDLNHYNQQSTSLRNIETLKNDLVEQIDNTLSNVFKVNETEKVNIERITTEIDLLKQQIKQKLFDAFSNDIWSNTSAAKRDTFLSLYLNKYLMNNKFPDEEDIAKFYQSLYNEGNIQSTFINLKTKFEDIVDGTLSKKDTSLDYEDTHKALEQYKRTKEYVLFGQGSYKVRKSRYDNPENIVPPGLIERLHNKATEPTFTGISSYVLKETRRLEEEGNLIKKQRIERNKVYEQLRKDVPDIIESMQSDYLLALLGTPNGVQGLFTEQIQQVNSVINRYGLSFDTLYNTLKSATPKIESIGESNLAIVYGPDSQVVTDLLQYFKMDKDKPLKKLLDKKARLREGLKGNMVQFALDAISTNRRYVTASLLGGVLVPAIRFFGYNSFTAPMIMLTSIGHKGMTVRQAARFTAVAGSFGIAPSMVVDKVGPFTLGRAHSRVTFAPDNEIIIKAKPGGSVRDYTAGELRAIIAREGIESSRADIDFYDTQLYRMMIDANLTYKGVSRSILEKVWDNISPSRNNFLTRFGRHQDSQMRRFVFLDSLNEGKSLQEAAELARRSLLDYGSLSKLERETVSNFIYFYTFMRTMGAEVINGLTSGSKITANLLRFTNLLTKQMSVNYEEMTDAQLGRIYNIYQGTIDDINTYMSGPPNPLTQGFEFFMTLPMYGASVMLSDKTEADSALDKTLNLTGSLLSTFVEGSPYLSLVRQGVSASMKGKAPSSFPKELIYAAEEQGMLDALIRDYNLVGYKYDRPGAALASDGKYYTWGTGTAGVKQYQKYLMRKAIGYSAFQLFTTKGLDEVYTKTGMSGISNLMVNTPPSRGGADFAKAGMFAAEDKRFTSPYDQSVEIVLPTASKYYKASNKQSLNVSQDMAYSLFMLGLATPTGANNLERQVLFNMRNTLTKLREFDKKYKPKE